MREILEIVKDEIADMFFLKSLVKNGHEKQCGKIA